MEKPVAPMSIGPRIRPRHRTIALTPKEIAALRACINGELDNDDGMGGDYMPALRRIVRKLDRP